MPFLWTVYNITFLICILFLRSFHSYFRPSAQYSKKQRKTERPGQRHRPQDSNSVIIKLHTRPHQMKHQRQKTNNKPYTPRNKKQNQYKRQKTHKQHNSIKLRPKVHIFTHNIQYQHSINIKLSFSK